MPDSANPSQPTATTFESSPRFGGINRLYGTHAEAVFHRAHVAVIGIGGVGSWAAEALARSGIGEITLVDMDDICVTNTNRQIHTLSTTIGQLKTEVMAERIKAINPRCTVHIIDDFISTDNVRELMQESWHGVIEATDSASVKAAIIYWCKRNKKIIVTTGAAGGKKDPTNVALVDLNKTTNDPLAAKVRRLLKRHYNFSKTPKRHWSVPCVYSTEKMQYPQLDGSVCQNKTDLEHGVRLDCAGGFGAITMVTATFGFVATSTMLDKILKKHRSK